MNDMRKLIESIEQIEEAGESLPIRRFVIRNKETNKFHKGAGKHGTWVDLEHADLYKAKLQSLWWDEETMELVPVQVTLL